MIKRYYKISLIVCILFFSACAIHCWSKPKGADEVTTKFKKAKSEFLFLCDAIAKNNKIPEKSIIDFYNPAMKILRTQFNSVTAEGKTMNDSCYENYNTWKQHVDIVLEKYEAVKNAYMLECNCKFPE